MPSSYPDYDSPATTTIDGWFRSAALDNLQELRLYPYPRLMPPPPLRRFSSTLRVVSFCSCTFPDQDENNNGGAPPEALLFPVLESLTLSDVSISERALHALLAGCTALQSLVLSYSLGFRRLRIVSPSLRSISLGWHSFELVIEDAPSLERLQCLQITHMNISVVSAPRLAILGTLFNCTPRIQFGTTVLQGSTVVSMAAVVDTVKVLSLSGVRLCLGAAINLLKCFPKLENLHIKATSACVDNAWYETNPERIGTLNICLRKIVLENYQGSNSHVDFVNFFLSSARALESVELRVRNITTNKWIRRQHSLLSRNSASRFLGVTFVSNKKK